MSRRIEAAVMDYVRKHRSRLRAQLDYFCKQPTFDAAINAAGMARDARGKRFAHQCRVRKKALRECTSRLLARRSTVAAAGSFDELHRIVESAIVDLLGVGDLMVYDTSLRLGARLGLCPQVVYLHAGTRQGAKAIGLDRGHRTLKMSELPPAFQRLEPCEVEDCLCIYKDMLAGRSMDPKKPTC